MVIDPFRIDFFFIIDFDSFLLNEVLTTWQSLVFTYITVGFYILLSFI